MTENIEDLQEALASAHAQHASAVELWIAQVSSLGEEIERLQALNAMLQDMNENQRKMIERLDNKRRELEADLQEADRVLTSVGFGSH